MDRPRDWDELEQRTGIRRNVPKSVTQNDVANLTRKRLSRSPFWKRKRRR